MTNPPTTASPILLCPECSCGVANDDWSHLDFVHPPEKAASQYKAIHVKLEEVGYLIPIGPIGLPDSDNDLQCPICDGAFHGWMGHVWRAA